MHRAVSWIVLLLATGVTAARADTLAAVLAANGVQLPASLPDRDQTVRHLVLAKDGATTLVVYDIGGPRGPAQLVALRLAARPGASTRVPLAWPKSAPEGLDADTCSRLDSLRADTRTVLVTAHVNPSASCTPSSVATSPCGPSCRAGRSRACPTAGSSTRRTRSTSRRSTPWSSAFFDPGQVVDVPLYPRQPYQAVRAAHVARMRQAYTDAWCAARNHSCDPEVFDESLASEIVADSGGDALGFIVAFDNTGGWTDTERWGRLEPFRELRAALARWDGQGVPPEALARGLVAGLGRARSLNAGPLIAAALSGDPELRDLVGAVLASPRPDGVDAAGWPAALDRRWSDAATWRRLARAIDVPDEFTEVVYVYAGLRPPGPIRYRELLRRDVEARFGHASLAPLVEPTALRQLFGDAPGP